MTTTLTDPELVEAAFVAAKLADPKLTWSRFALTMVTRDPSTVYRWRRGLRPIPKAPRARLLKLAGVSTQKGPS